MKSDPNTKRDGGCPPTTCSAFTDEQAHYIANELKRWLKSGFTVKATDPANVLIPLPDGSIHGGVTITAKNKVRVSS